MKKRTSSPANLAEIEVEEGATALLIPITYRWQLIDRSDDMATKINIQFYSNARNTLLKAMLE